MKTKVTNTVPHDFLAYTFIQAYEEDIMKFALCHHGLRGFVSVKVTRDYALESMKFIRREADFMTDLKEFDVVNTCKNRWPYYEDEPDYYCFEIYFPEIGTYYRSGVFYNKVDKIIPSFFCLQ